MLVLFICCYAYTKLAVLRIVTRKMVKYRTNLTLFCLFVKWSSQNSPSSAPSRLRPRGCTAAWAALLETPLCRCCHSGPQNAVRCVGQRSALHHRGWNLAAQQGAQDVGPRTCIPCLPWRPVSRWPSATGGPALVAAKHLQGGLLPGRSEMPRPAQTDGRRTLPQWGMCASRLFRPEPGPQAAALLYSHLTSTLRPFWM